MTMHYVEICWNGHTVTIRGEHGTKLDLARSVVYYMCDAFNIHPEDIQSICEDILNDQE